MFQDLTPIFLLKLINNIEYQIKAEENFVRFTKKLILRKWLSKV